MSASVQVVDEVGMTVARDKGGAAVKARWAADNDHTVPPSVNGQHSLSACWRERGARSGDSLDKDLDQSSLVVAEWGLSHRPPPRSDERVRRRGAASAPTRLPRRR